MTTPAGNAVSASDLIVPPSGVAAADVIATTRLSADGPAQSIGLFATGKYGLVLFDGGAGAWMSLHVSNFTVTPAQATIAYTVYKPDNTQLASGTLSGTNLSIHLPALPTAGTYSLLLRSGIAQASLDAKLETNRLIPADGTTLAVVRSSGQSERVLIAASAGDQKALMVSGLAMMPAGNTLDINVALPSGSTFRRASAVGLGATTALPAFTVTGTHAVTLVPSAGTTQTIFKVALLSGVDLPVNGAAGRCRHCESRGRPRASRLPVLPEKILGLGVSG